MFVLAGLTSLGVLALDHLSLMDRVEWPLILEILALITALFFVPCTLLGTISPIVVKLAMHDLSQAGRTVGQIYAFGSAGSIAGTFLTGFWLIARFGTYAVVWGVAVVLLFLGLLFLLGRRRWLTTGLALLVVAGASAIASARDGSRTVVCTRQTTFASK